MQQLSIEGKTKEDLAIEFLQEHEPPEGYFLGFSGGKDSVVTEHIAKLSGVKYQAYYSATGIDPPEIVHFIQKHYPEVIFCRPLFRMPRKDPEWEGTRSFFGMIPRVGFPTKRSRWCCKYLKKDPMKHIPLDSRIMGLRAEESAQRAKHGPISVVPYFKNQIIYKPIFSWLEWEVWEHIDRYELPYCSLYDEGFGRLGCVICPMICGSGASNQRRIAAHRKKWPRQYVAFEKAMRRLWDRDNGEWRRQRGFGSALTFEQFLDNWYRGNSNNPKAGHTQEKLL